MDYWLFLLFFIASVIATLLLYARQPLLVAYFAAGVVLGPYGLDVFSDVDRLSQIAHIGIVSLLFLIGLEMQPKALLKTLSESLGVFFVATAVLLGLFFGLAIILGFNVVDSLIIAIAAQFSSTIIGIKLLPTTVLHHRHLGDLMVGILLLQDILAIFVIIILDNNGIGSLQMLAVLGAAPLLVLFAFAGVQYVIAPLLVRFERYHEYIFLLSLGWMMGLALLGSYFKLSAEIGAFIAGVSLATLPITRAIAVSMHPIRDFFLVIFFATIGANIDLNQITEHLFNAVLIAMLCMASKPVIYRLVLTKHSESNNLSWDIGIRLGVLSEFSLIVVFLATQGNYLSESAAQALQLATIITMILNTYWVTNFLPNPLAIKKHLKRD